MPLTHVVNKRANIVVAVFCVHLGFSELIVQAQEFINNLVARHQFLGLETTLLVKLNMMAKHCRIGFEQPRIVQRGLQELTHFIWKHLQAVEQLVVSLHQSAAHKVRRLLMFNNAESRVKVIQPLIKGTEF